MSNFEKWYFNLWTTKQLVMTWKSRQSLAIFLDVNCFKAFGWYLIFYRSFLQSLSNLHKQIITWRWTGRDTIFNNIINISKELCDHIPHFYFRNKNHTTLSVCWFFSVFVYSIFILAGNSFNKLSYFAFYHKARMAYTQCGHNVAIVFSFLLFSSAAASYLLSWKCGLY